MMIERNVTFICLAAMASLALAGCGTSGGGNGHTFTVDGAVYNPGVYRLPAEGLTVQQALAMAGGPVTGNFLSGEVDAYLRKVSVTRQHNERTEEMVIDARSDLERTNTLSVEPGDRIFVPRKL